jgi:hypothetical protein
MSIDKNDESRLRKLFDEVEIDPEEHAAFGPGHVQIRAVWRDFVALYTGWGRADRAAVYQRRLESK